MRRDRTAGHIVIVDADGSEAHIFVQPTDWASEQAEALKTAIKAIVSAELGPPAKRTVTQERETGAAQYTWETETLEAPSYEVHVIDEEVYAGAAGGVDQILIFIRDTAAGVASHLLARVLDAVSGAGFQVERLHPGDDLFQRARDICQSRLGAVGHVEFTDVDQTGENAKIVARDGSGASFELLLGRRGELLKAKRRA